MRPESFTCSRKIPGLLYKYVILTKPKWFGVIKKEPLPSMLRHGLEGTTVVKVVRELRHIKAVATLRRNTEQVIAPKRETATFIKTLRVKPKLVAGGFALG